MPGLVTVLLVVITGMFCSFVTYLPFIGDVNSAPNQHVTPVYIEAQRAGHRVAQYRYRASGRL